MKGQFKSIRKLIQKACSEQAFGVKDSHVRLVNALSSQDLKEIQETGKLSSDRYHELAADEETVRHVISLLVEWFQILSQSLSDLSDEELDRRGMKIIRINDGLSVVSYDENFEYLDQDE